VAEGMVELKARRGTEVVKVKIDDVVAVISDKIIAERTGGSR
jgi:hypothetical protein